MKPTFKTSFLRMSRFNLIGLVMLCILLTTSSSCDDDDDTPAGPTKNIVALAQANTNLTSLVAALTKYPDLVSTLSSTSNEFTVFAPTNDAFADFLDAIGQESINDVPESVLRSVLEYHVLAGNAVRSTELTAGNIETVNGEEVAVTIAGGVKLNGSVNVTAADVEATNGIVHLVDAVLVPPSVVPVVGTIVAPAYFNKNFSTLVAAVVQAGLLDDLLSTSANYTLFAPTNDAFAAAGITALPPNTTEGNATLSSILLYHVLTSEVKSVNLPVTGANDPEVIATLSEESFYLSNRGGGAGVYINGSTQVVATDIEGSNGVVHVINRTLVPPSKTIADIAIDYSTSATPEFTQLVAALAKVPALLNAADAAGNLTVFAPTDAAFQALYTAVGVSNLNQLEAAIGNDKLAKVLQHHIVGARVFSPDLATGSVTTLNQNITINVSTLKITDANGSNPAAGLVPALLNVHATNGVIHVIDKVLIPTGIL